MTENLMGQMDSQTGLDVSGDPMGDATDLFGVKTEGDKMADGKYVARIHKVEKRPTKAGGQRLSIEYKVANGPHEGKTIYDGGYNLSDKVNPEKIEELMADGLSREEATEKATEGAKKAKEIGLRGAKKVAKAAGYIDPAEATAADKQKIADGTAWELTKNFKWSDIEGRLVLVTTKGKTNPRTGKTFQEVVKVESADNVGDVGSALPF